MHENKEIFESMPVPRALATLAVPTIISQLITMIYNLADTFFIGRTNDPYKVAAASLAYVLFFVLTALSNLFGIGGGSLISRLLGAGDHQSAKKVCAFSFYGAIVISATYSLCCFLFMEPLLTLMGASEYTMPYAIQYALWVVVVGGIPATLSMTMAHLLRREGYAKYASLGLGMGGVLNIILDPLFMFVLMPQGMEVTGAAVATMISNICALIYFLLTFFLLRKRTVLSFSFREALPQRHHIVSIFAVGFPSALNSFLACVSNTLINKLTSAYGDIPLAAMGIVKKIDMLPLNVGMGLCQGMMPLVAYNYSTGNYKRMRETAHCARMAGICFAGLCIVAFQFFSPQIIRLFIQEEATVAYGIDFLRIACTAVPMMIINAQMTYTFQAIGKGKQSLLLSCCRQGIIKIPLLFLINSIFHLYGIIWTQTVADAITLAISFTLYSGLKRELALQEKEALQAEPV